jgi:hypothetical protein
MSLDGMPYTYEQVGDALKKIRKQFLKGTKVLKWTGPDKLDSSVSATMSPPSWHFSPEGLEYHKERGRDFWDVYANVAFVLGYHSGVLIQRAEHEPQKELLEMFRKSVDLMNRKNPA